MSIAGKPKQIQTLVYKLSFHFTPFPMRRAFLTLDFVISHWLYAIRAKGNKAKSTDTVTTNVFTVFPGL
jgi:hypothetical protein